MAVENNSDALVTALVENNADINVLDAVSTCVCKYEYVCIYAPHTVLLTHCMDTLYGQFYGFRIRCL